MTDAAKATSSPKGAGSIDFDDLMRKYDTESRFRMLKGWRGLLVTVLAVSMGLFHLYTAGFGLLPFQAQGAVHLTFGLALTILLFPARQGKMTKSNKIPWYDFLLVGVAAVSTLYVVFNELALAERAGSPILTDIVMGILLVLVIMEATRRITSPILSVLAAISLLYCYFGPYLPEGMAHRGFSIERIVNHMYLGTEGIFGTPLEVSSTFVFMFILFGSVLEKTGIGKFIIDLSLAVAGKYSGGPAKVAVVSSGLMGTVSGSSVANVCSTGMFTIPLMKSVGYRPHFAGAVEAVASTGGQIMPPIMGSGAFIMAQFLNVSYLTVAAAAIIPALLYYTSVLLQVHLEAKRLGLQGIESSRLPSVVYLLRTRGYLLIPLFVIVKYLLDGSTPLWAAFCGILSCAIISAIVLVIKVAYAYKQGTFDNTQWGKLLKGVFASLVDTFESGSRAALSVACACACVGIIIGTGTLTGVALRIASGIIDLSGGLLLPTMILTMCASIVLGTGLPTTANFIITSAMAAPALVQLGVPPLAAYMFVFYFGIAADLTPPVALAAYAGAGIAGAEPMKTGLTAFKLALAGLIVPYIYVFNPILLLIDAEPVRLFQAVCTALLGVFLLATATIGYFRCPMNIALRALALVGALGLLDPGTLTDIIGLCILGFIVFVQTVKAHVGKPGKMKEETA